MKCKNCKELCHISNEYDEVITWCHKINDCPDIEAERVCDKYVIMTNADRIRNMSDDTLAIFIHCVNCKGDDKLIIRDEKCRCCSSHKHIVEWLKSKAKS